MKLKNIFAMPFALAADIVSCGNIGGSRSFTQQVIDKDKNEQAVDDLCKVIKSLRHDQPKKGE